MRQFMAGLICGVALLFMAMHFHLVRDNNGFSFVPKIQNNLSDIYVDVRRYDLEKWKQHKPLAAAIMKSTVKKIQHQQPQPAAVVSQPTATSSGPSMGDQFQGMVSSLLAKNP